MRLGLDTKEIDHGRAQHRRPQEASRQGLRGTEKARLSIEDKAHARNAKARASQAVKAGRMSRAEASKIGKKADAVLKGH